MAVMIRSVVCKVVNESGTALVFANEEIAHGSFDSDRPTRVDAGKSAEWKSSTCGFMTGTEGWVAFTVEGTSSTFTVTWDNPFIGDNTFQQTCPGLAGYRPATPTGQDPETQEALSEEDLRENDDVLVTYTFATTPAQSQDAPPVPPGDQPNNQDPKPTEVQPGKPVLVRDADVANRKLVFIGVNDPQANSEAAALEARVPKVDAKDRMAAFTGATPGDAPAFYRDWGQKADEEWIATITTLQPGQDKALLDCLLNAPNESPVASTSDSRKKQNFKRFEIRAFAKILAAVEAEVRLIEADEAKGIKPDAAPMKRLVISAHHRPRSRDYWIGWFYSYNYLYIHMDDIAALGRVFPKAMAQVEDILVGACNSAHWKEKPVPMNTWEIIPRFLSICPNVQTVWGYDATGPSSTAASDDFAAWETASRKSNAKEDIVKAAHDRRFLKSGGKPIEGFHSIVWVLEGGSLKPRKV